MDGDDTLYGRAGDDLMLGGLGNDLIYGEEGNDRLFGDAGDDLLEGGDGNDGLGGEAGNDIVRGGAGNDTLGGLTGNDVLEGGDGNDLLHGHVGEDILTGGSAADQFAFDVELMNPSNGIDLITDFEALLDRIEIAGSADANPALAGSQEWDFVGASYTGAPLANGNGQATLSQAGGETILNLYHADGDAVADFTLRFTGAHDQIQLFEFGTSNGLINYYPLELSI